MMDTKIVKLKIIKKDSPGCNFFYSLTTDNSHCVAEIFNDNIWKIQYAFWDRQGVADHLNFFMSRFLWKKKVQIFPQQEGNKGDGWRCSAHNKHYTSSHFSIPGNPNNWYSPRRLLFTTCLSFVRQVMDIWQKKGVRMLGDALTLCVLFPLQTCIW